MKTIVTGLIISFLAVISPVGTAHAAQVYNTDLVVKGSECLGIDCEDAPAFGYDTLVFKENNLRIYFEDTSSTSSFPRNDWRITINDRVNGGKNKFSIDDVSSGRTPFTIEAGAKVNSLFIDPQNGDFNLDTIIQSPCACTGIDSLNVNGDMFGCRDGRRNLEAGYSERIWRDTEFLWSRQYASHFRKSIVGDGGW